MKFKIKVEPDEDEMDDMEDDGEMMPKKGSGKKALHAALMDQMMSGKKKHGPRCQCAKCAAKK
jgi:hypothetical protein